MVSKANRSLHLALALAMLAVPAIEAYASNPCAELLQQDPADYFKNWVRSARAFLRLSDTRERKLEVASEFVALIEETWGVPAFVHRYRGTENSVLVGLRAPRSRDCVAPVHWLQRVRCHLAKRKFQLVFEIHSGKDTIAPAWVMDQPALVSLPMESLSLDRADAVFVHEWLHMEVSYSQRKWKNTPLDRGPRAREVPLFIVNHKALRAPDLEHWYGGSKKNGDGHWIDENDAYLKEARFEIAYVHAAIQKLNKSATVLTSKEYFDQRNAIRRRLESATVLLDNFFDFERSDMHLLKRMRSNLEKVRTRVSDSDPTQVIVELKKGGSHLLLPSCSAEKLDDLLDLQIAHLEDLRSLALRVKARLRGIARESEKL